MRNWKAYIPIEKTVEVEKILNKYDLTGYVVGHRNSEILIQVEYCKRLHSQAILEVSKYLDDLEK